MGNLISQFFINRAQLSYIITRNKSSNLCVKCKKPIDIQMQEYKSVYDNYCRICAIGKFNNYLSIN